MVVAPPAATTPAPPGGWPVPASLYVHVPFCRHRCGYCNFSVIAGRDDLQEVMVDALIAELRQIAPTTQRPLETVFLGGGTPTQLSRQDQRRLVGAIRDHFPIRPDAEISVEANPEDIDDEQLHGLADLGINRVSLGVQSFNARKLQQLERSHSGDQALAAIEASDAVIGNVSIDLIFGAPGETVEDWEEDLRQAVRAPVRHLSAYALTFEKGTVFWNRLRRGEFSGDLCTVDEDAELAMDDAADRYLPAAGLQRYEISNFARPGGRCRHNTAYWAGDGWYAVGPGAARFVSGRREVNHRSPTTYLHRIRQSGRATAESEAISLDQYAREKAAFGIRQIAGVDLAAVASATNIDLADDLAETWENMGTAGLIARTDDHVKLTKRGLLFADTVASRILSDASVKSR